MEFLKSIFGHSWRKRFFFFIIIYLILLLWPSLVFFKSIEFNPAEFTEEWIKNICSLSIIFLILEYQKYLFDLIKRRSHCSDVLQRKIIDPATSLLDFLNTKAYYTQEDVDEINIKWANFYTLLKDINMRTFDVKFRNNDVYEFQQNFQLAEINEEMQQVISHEKIFISDNLKNTLNKTILLFQEELKKLK